MINVNEIVELWNGEQSKYEALGLIINDFIREKITDYELFPEIHYRTKDLLSIVKKIKKKQFQKNYTYYHLKDKLGFRIICTFQEEMDIIDRFLKENFKIIDVEYKQENLDFNKLDYISNHYDSFINCSIKEFKKFKEFENLIFEIQVRTLNQHAWSNTAHSLSYKQETDLPNNLKRRVYRLLSLYELADDEFSIVNKSLKDNKNTIVYSLLSKLEGKFYKFAKFDFDRETSIFYISVLIGYFINEDSKFNLLHNIESFILTNEKKIENIFNQNRSRFYELILLTQPEVFIIWYMLENNYYVLNDKWENDFDIEDLEQIKNLWGNEL